MSLTAVAMSGGLDSSVTAWLLARQGQPVVGLSMLLWDHSGVEAHGRCCGALDLGDARRVAQQAGIPHYTLRMDEEFRQKVVDPFVSDYLTGRRADGHGIVANGWYERAECEVRFWRQSNKLVQAPKIWETARAEDPSFTCANLFWWFNMYSTADYAVTPRPMYPADGRKLPDVWTQPGSLRDDLPD